MATATATPVDWTALKALTDAGLSSDQIRALGQQNQPGQQFIPTVQNGQIIHPTTGTDRASVTFNAPPTITPTDVPAVSQDQIAARASASSSASLILKQYGLESLIPIVDQWIKGGMSWEEAQLAFYDSSTDAGKIFDARFPAIKIRRDAGAPPISPAEYVAYENTATQYLRSAGMPQGFYDTKDDFTQLIANDVSTAELKSRIEDGYVAANQAPPDVKAELYNFYGVDDGHLAAYFLDPTRALPLIQRQVAAAKIGAASERVGVGVQQGTAENLAAFNLSDQGATDLFGKVAHDLPNMQDLQKRFNDPNDPLSADSYAKALVINDPSQLAHLARLVGQNQSLFSGQHLLARDQQGGLTGLLAH